MARRFEMRFSPALGAIVIMMKYLSVGYCVIAVFLEVLTESYCAGRIFLGIGIVEGSAIDR